MPRLVKKGSLTPYLTTVRTGTRGNSGFKSVKKYSISSRKRRKALQINTKNLVQAFGSVRPEFEPHFLKIPENSGTLSLTEFYPSPGIGQKPALTPYLTTIRKFHNRV